MEMNRCHIDAREVEAKLIEGLMGKELDLYNGEVKDISKLEWLDKDTSFFLDLKCSEGYKNKVFYRDIESNIKYYNSKRSKYYTKEDGTKVEVSNTVISLDEGYNVAGDLVDYDAYKVVEDKLLAKILINKFVDVQNAIVEADSRRTPLIYLIRDYLNATDSRKRFKCKKRLSSTLEMHICGVSVAELVYEMIDNKITKGYLLDNDFNLSEYIDAVDI